ncbi:MAG: sigma-54-dependent Fis family transcriptional regulator, partial [Bacteroidetes bacterium]
MEVSQNILILDDEKGFREEIGEFLKEEGYHVHTAGLPSEALQIISNNDIDIAVFDIRMPEMDGLTFLNQIKQEYKEIEIIMMTGYGDMSSVITAMRYGAVDFLKKPFKLTEIKETINRISKYRSVKSKVKKESTLFKDMIDDKLHLVGNSPALKRIFDLVIKVSKSEDATVLLTGETGTGKELIAKTIHSLSSRKDNKFVVVNCSTIPDELFENEFFGHVKGSYTDAKQDQIGLFEAANKGTLFLDEIGDLKYEMQAKLLRVIEDKKVSRLGDYDEKEVDVRIIAATNHNLDEMVQSGIFRSDLYYRLNTFHFPIPPLRKRGKDLIELVDYFLDRFCREQGRESLGIDAEALNLLYSYPWPGNVRELRNVLERIVLTCKNSTVTAEMLPEKVRSQATMKKKTNVTSFDLQAQEKQLIVGALEQCGWNQSESARKLGISRNTL